MIEYDETANGYQLPSEIEWEYAGTLGKAPDEKIELITRLYELKPEPPAASGLYLMNSIYPEWCNDEGPVNAQFYEIYEEIDEEEQDGRGVMIETHVSRAHCGKDKEEYKSNYYYSSYLETQRKREYKNINSENSFRVIRHK